MSDAKSSTLERQALVALRRMRDRLDELERQRSEPIAIIGMGCRFPGGVTSPAEYWKLLANGVDAIREIPNDRWRIDDYYDPKPGTPGKTYSRWGGFLDRVDLFDADFFGISPREARRVDPQQRLFLEVAWEALEHAGIPPLSLRESATGIFVGTTTTDYLQLLQREGSIEDFDAYVIAGNALNATAGRLAYFLGTQGPCMAIDTACSSSLVAIDRACRSVREGESSLAIAGGVNLMLTPEMFVSAANWGMLAPDGRCKTFDAEANGFVRAEGCGVVLLKRLGAAIADGNPVLAVIRGSAVNQDGRSSGLSVPNGRAQEAVIRTALRNSQIDAASVSYVEAHGTGTSLGDPIEVEALGRVFHADPARGTRMALGAAKTNIGHLESAAGVAGLMKVVLMLQHGQHVPHLHLRTPSPHIAWDRYPFEIPSALCDWPAVAGKRIAGVSAFGASGTNAHLIVEEAPALPAVSRAMERPLHILTVTARDAVALRAGAERLRAYLQSHPDTPFPDICFSANAGRSALQQRLSVTAATALDAAASLDRFLQGEQAAALAHGQVAGSERRRIACLFTGQGSQYPGMGRELFDTSPVFRHAIERCDALLREELDRPLPSILYPSAQEGSLIDETRYTQPALFALEYALYELWRSWGLEPDYVMGHSVGEYVAACVAGVLSLEDALRLIAHRGRLMQSQPPGGTMLAVAASPNDVGEFIAHLRARVSIAAINGPSNVVISGAREQLESVATLLSARGITHRELTVSHAFHSALMEPMLASFASVLSTISLRSPKLRLISNLTGRVASDAEMTDNSYWVRHVREPVQFAVGMQTLAAAGCDIFLELGPAPVLAGMGRYCVPDDASFRWLPSLRPGCSDWSQMLSSVQSLFQVGANVDWRGFDQEYARRHVSLPTYPFQRERHWLTSRAASSAASPAHVSPTKAAAADLFTLSWREASPQAPAVRISATASQRWLILADSSGIAAGLRCRLLTDGSECLVAHTGDSFASQPDGSFMLDPANPEHFKRLLARYSAAMPLTGVVCLWNAGANETSDLSLRQLQQAQLLGCGTALHLLQAMAAAAGAATSAIWLVTRGCQPVATTESPQPPVRPASASLTGFARVAASEFAELACRHIDLAADEEAGAAAAGLHSAMKLDWRHEKELALRDGRIWLPTLSSLPAASGDNGIGPWHVRVDGTYLITGGMGALGLATARWLVDAGARHLLLCGRRDSSAAARARIDEWRRRGVQVVIAACDISNAEDVDRLFDRVAADMAPLRGVVHAAGVLDDGVVLHQTWPRFEKVLAAKVLGAWLLHERTRSAELDFFVVYSALAAIIGNAGQSSYAAANAFLDALAHGRRAQGLPATSINWGPWADSGMAAALSAADRQRLSDRGLEPMAAEQALDALARILRQGWTQVVATRADWSRFAAHPSARSAPALMRDLLVEPARTVEANDVAAQLARMPGLQRLPKILSIIERHAARTLGLAAGKQVPTQRPLRDLGMDSLQAVELRNALSATLARPLPATLLFDHPTLDQLAHHLLREILDLDTAEIAPAADAAAELERQGRRDAVLSLADEDAEACLLQELERSS